MSPALAGGLSTTEPPGKPHLVVWKIPWRRAWQPTPVVLPEKPMERGAWQAKVHGVAEESDDLETKKQITIL